MAKAMSGQIPVKPDVMGIAESARTAGKGKGAAPVHLWNPPFLGDIDMRIARDGTWYHEGAPIRRPAMVRLFSSILRRDGADYFLVTPVEKLGITVEDAPFVATDVTREGAGEGQVLIFETHVGDRIEAGPDHPIRVEIDAQSQEPAPYVHVRGGLEARIDRKSFYRMVEWGEEAGQGGERWFGVRSGGAFFAMVRAEDLSGAG